MSTLPPQLQELVDDFAAVGPQDRLQMLLELSRDLPPLPERYRERRDALEQVHECQSPLFLAVEVETGSPQQPVELFFDAPPEAPTTRGFAGILTEGLQGQPARAVLDVPDDFYLGLGLSEAVSPLRLRGMAAMLARIKRQVRLQTDAAGAGPA